MAIKLYSNKTHSVTLRETVNGWMIVLTMFIDENFPICKSFTCTTEWNARRMAKQMAGNVGILIFQA